jgi:hypothetical protein
MEGTFVTCSLLKNSKLPKYLDNVTTMVACYKDCINLEYVDMPISMNKLSLLGGASILHGAFANCIKIQKVKYPLNLPLLTTMSYCNYNCSLSTHYRLPTYMPNVTSLAVSFFQNLELTYLELPRVMNKVTTCNQMLQK